MILRIATIFTATAAIAYVVMSTMFWVVCKSMGHYSLEALLSFTATTALSVAFGVEGVLWLKDRSFGSGILAAVDKRGPPATLNPPD